jgi:hypothetical protein
MHNFGSLHVKCVSSNRMTKPLSVISLIAAAAMLFCAHDYNPFADLTNARVHVLAWSFAEKDSVPVYSTGTLKTVVALGEEVDSFRITAIKNRLWHDTIIRTGTSSDDSHGVPHLFSVSFFDTGDQTIKIQTYRSNGEVVPEEIPVRVYSPLHQEDVEGLYGIPMPVSTPMVIDNDAQYHWSFGPGREVSSLDSSTSESFSSGQTTGTGALWVTDLSNEHPTPRDSFFYTFDDTSKPVIYYFNDTLNRDTLLTDTIFVFRVHVIDNINRTVDTCSVNGGPFDFMNPRTNVYTKIIKDMTRYTRENGPCTLSVYAMDNPQFKNVARRTFWAYYDTSGEKNAEAKVTFIIPPEDSTSYMVSDIIVTGSAENYLSETMVVRIATNGSISSDYKVIDGKTGMWQWPVRLNAGRNRVTVAAYSTEDNRVLAADTAIITYDPNAADSIKPMIWGITTSDGREVENLCTRAGSEELRVIAFDEGSRIEAVLVNGDSARPTDADRYIWVKGSGNLEHGPNSITVRAIDLAGNFRDDTFVMFRNVPPLFTQPPQVPTSFCIDSACTLRFSYYDADNDPVTLQCRPKPAGMAVTADGRCLWRPDKGQIGIDSMVISLFDGYQQTPDTLFTFSIVDCSRAPIPVHFVTTERDFPGVLQAGADTMSVLLKTDTVQSDHPLRYSARFTDRNKSLVNNAVSPLLTWAPVEADTGYRRLLVTVGDGGVNYDTLYPTLHVVHRNEYPCSLSWTYTGTLTPQGELDLFSARTSDTLFFTINDRDDPLTESYEVTIARHNVRSVEVVSRRNFKVVIEPDPRRVLDTLVVTISDRTNSSDTAMIVVRYRFQTTARGLQLNTTASGAGVSGNVLNFPVLVRLNNGTFDFSNAERGGRDIRFRKANGNLLPYEIERWDSAAGAAEIWVRLDTVYGNDSTHYFELYQTARPAIDSSNSAAVFDTAVGFRGVWHMAEASGNVSEATALHYTGVRNGNQLQGSGAIGMAQVYDGVNSYTDMGNVLNPVSANFTVSAWVKMSEFNTIITFIGKSNGGDPSPTYGWLLTKDYNNAIHLYAANGGRSWGGPDALDMNTTATIADSSRWYHVTAVVNRSQPAASKIYVDGADVSSAAHGSLNANNPITNTLPLRIGAEADNDCRIAGSIDEVVVSYTIRSADWIKLCYMNQKEQDALVRFR